MHEVMITSELPAVVWINNANKTSPLNFHKCSQDALLKRWRPLLGDKGDGTEN